MEIKVAKTAGFCFGVNRAVELTYGLLAEGRRVATLGPLIHNPQAVADMQAKGAFVADSVPQVPDGYEVVIRSHGVPRSVYDELAARGIPYHDATCPFVQKIQRIAAEAEKAGAVLLVAGDKTHPEVQGIRGWGNDTTLVVEKPEQIDLAQAARYFGARGEADTATMALLQRCAVPLLAAATPRAVWLRAEVKALAEAGILRGSDVMRHLEGCGQAILLAVTLGPGVDAQIRRAGVGDIAAGVASDALGSALAEQTADAAEAELRQLAAAEGTYLTGRFSPGYGDWDIAVQPLVAAALDTARRAGLCVTDTNLMTPRKSVTAILGVSDHPVKGYLAGCGHCVLRTRCEYRKRGKTCASE